MMPLKVIEMKYDDLIYDILKEVFNIGVGKAADMLSEIIDKKILLDVPSIKIIEPDNKDVEFDEFFYKGIKGTWMVSSICFEEKINGEANLIFPAEKTRSIINFCTKQEDENIGNDLEFTDIDYDIVRELGNIILNSIIGEMGNFLDINLEYTLPNVRLFNRMDFENDIKDRRDLSLLMLSISFILDDTEIEGAIIISLTINSLNEVINIIKRMEVELNE